MPDSTTTQSAAARLRASAERDRALADAATPGPWAYDYEQEKGMGWYVGQFVVGGGLPVSGNITEYEFEHCWENGELKEDFEEWQPIGVEPVCEGHHSNTANAEFIAASRAIVPRQAEQIRVLVEALEEVVHSGEWADAILTAQLALDAALALEVE